MENAAINQHNQSIVSDVPTKKFFKLSILIPTLPARLSTFNIVINNLRDQIKKGHYENDVEIISLMDCKTMTVGDKRNKLIELSSGEYVVFVDDDDGLPSYYIKEILQATETKPDCIGIRGVIKYEGKIPDSGFIHSLRYNCDEEVNLYTKGRSPNHLNPIKRSIADQVKFPSISYGEDADWAKRIYFHLKSEVLIDKIMYVYFAYGSKSQSSPSCKLSWV